MNDAKHPLTVANRTEPTSSKNLEKLTVIRLCNTSSKCYNIQQSSVPFIETVFHNSSQRSATATFSLTSDGVLFFTGFAQQWQVLC